MKPIAVMIVDDSAVVRQVLSALLAEQPDIEVIGVAADPLFALEKMQRRWPDVVVLDVEMPRMDGLTFLRKLMAERPTPVVICSTLTEAGAQTTLQALAEGAVSIVTKPRMGLRQFLIDSRQELVHAIQGAARANLGRLTARPAVSALPALPLSGTQAMLHTTDRVVAIGTSTGGTQALETILTVLPRTCPGLVIVQHMPERFTKAFAERLDRLCQIEIREAEDGDRVMPGRALIAPGGRHMLLQRSGAQYRVEIRDGPPVSRHRPSVDVLFRSAARAAGANALGIIMTGMGSDGARGLKEMRDAGARTLAQDEATCVVFGMPREAVKLGAAEQVLPLGEIPGAIVAARTGRG
ncbi:protein-glutamate methylesterase/protein-glutamine glutaminase [Pseudomonas indica]|uniref:Protein-glutamate methylesterase/protein-glutamine glutaminase n=1 Tax=Pseudomonas indica TaxID=137658 RepID=A0A1G9H733_9PSED|nr:chemotaxis response regulator protein-glutamate methylesterase [Pseudomonas indica]MBU3057624.1 chemotaxis response regulator protein-glutamate methylesterase [Pseudomonas indica]PAU52035.1 chemotaxis response regulator protein-glutamate methylesterase [Pseudomonas indica]SDL08786.1 two-component system, chemotaxis family, response regulator CheB [Pseudomonas indica]